MNLEVIVQLHFLFSTAQIVAANDVTCVKLRCCLLEFFVANDKNIKSKKYVQEIFSFAITNPNLED